MKLNFVKPKEYFFRISILAQFLSLTPLLVSNSILFGVYYYFYGFNFNNIVFWSVFSFRLITDIIPTVFIHFLYFYKNFNSLLQINIENKSVNYLSNKNNITFNFNEIKSIKCYCSFGRKSWYSFESYRYCKIELLNSEAIYISSLMVQDIENMFKKLFETDVETIAVFFCIF